MSKYDEMSDFEINKAVVKALATPSKVEFGSVFLDHGFEDGACVYTHADYCSNPKDAWPIIVENKINTYPESESDNEIGMATFTGNWGAVCFDSDDGEFAVDCQYFEAVSDKPLRAAMIVFLMMKEGEQCN